MKASTIRSLPIWQKADDPMVGLLPQLGGDLPYVLVGDLDDVREVGPPLIFSCVGDFPMPSPHASKSGSGDAVDGVRT